MTLKGPCDFKLEDFYAAPSELFEPYYGMHMHITIRGEQKLVVSQVMDYSAQA